MSMPMNKRRKVVSDEIDLEHILPMISRKSYLTGLTHAKHWRMWRKVMVQLMCSRHEECMGPGPVHDYYRSWNDCTLQDILEQDHHGTEGVCLTSVIQGRYENEFCSDSER